MYAEVKYISVILSSNTNVR